MAIKETSFSEFQELVACAKEEKRRYVSVLAVSPADHLTPLSIAAQVAKYGQPFALLESVSQGQHLGRYSIIALRPFLRLSVRKEKGVIKALDEAAVYVAAETSAPLDQISALLSYYSPLAPAEAPPFTGGAISYIGFEATPLFEPAVIPPAHDDLMLPDVQMLFFHHLIIYDHTWQQIILAVNTAVGFGDAAQTFECAQCDLRSLRQFLQNDLRPLEPLPAPTSPVTSTHTRESYHEMVRSAKEYVAMGDVFQVVLSQRFSTTTSASGLDLYRHLRRLNPSPYMFFLNLGKGVELIGASPEVMVQVVGEQVLLRPIAGTRRRGRDAAEDERLAHELIHDPKELAEHMMLVDLARNDVGRSAMAGTIRLTKHLTVENYATVMHIVSEVVGKRDPRLGVLTIVGQCIPAGTLSGAPKIMAMNIIATLEGRRRGPYGGAVGYFTDQTVDTGIFIRSLIKIRDRIYWQAGGGIVADSQPEAEYQETLAKGRAIGQLHKEAWDEFVAKGGK
ncbi:hypothetical protein A2936_01985 [Candidatus Uhrbacteria bacterium RIFCSPLOWO2_01_FULL_47_25]|uniref:Anthranilate synthase component 1 n=1 Tax=Candidatus Uhrbacteria bacterium RIFCSPLOWO2_01_FULL_47_25 TaxID=1802402 RepID=A0A1F7UVX6_9BACT|nr:MAG: hypothetical protein A2936_01985 [Candidatus Uhrbacteria bacterium RIFCSPLOWO2_01_FULL_47_25]